MSELPELPIDLRLVVVDMDGTLLDDQGRLPAGFWETLHRLRERGIVFAVASGRQYATLAGVFAADPAGIVFIAENGTFVMRDGEELSSAPLAADYSARFIEGARAVIATGYNLGVVRCGRRSAYVESQDPAFQQQAAVYFAALRVVDDLLAVEEDALKFSVYDFGDPAGGSAAALGEFADPCRVVVSTPHWMDVMQPGVDKGIAVRELQAELGITADQTVVFGDYLNDLEMLGSATHSFAMANAHPEVLRRARYLAPANHERGVVRALAHVLDRQA